MTLEIFSRDVVPIIQAALSLIGLTGLLFVWLQIRESAKWNKLQAQQAFIQNDSHEYENKVILAGTKNGVPLKSRTDSITEEELDKILSDDEFYLPVMTLLNDAECIATSINAGLVDWELAYNIHSHRMMRWFNIFRPMIEKLRTDQGEQELYIEIQKFVTRVLERNKSNVAKKIRETGISTRA